MHNYIFNEDEWLKTNLDHRNQRFLLLCTVANLFLKIVFMIPKQTVAIIVSIAIHASLYSLTVVCTIAAVTLRPLPCRVPPAS